MICIHNTDEDDYQRIRGSQQEQLITNTMRRASAEVTIRTDNVYFEGVEEFSLDLFFASPQTGFFVLPNITTVTINDTTSEYIMCLVSHQRCTVHCRPDHWFHWSTLPGHGVHGPMIFTVGVIGDTTLATDVVVSFSTANGSTLSR